MTIVKSANPVKAGSPNQTESSVAQNIFISYRKYIY